MYSSEVLDKIGYLEVTFTLQYMVFYTTDFDFTLR